MGRLEINVRDYGVTHCPWADSGYCPVPTQKGCVTIDNKIVKSIEEYEQQWKEE